MSQDETPPLSFLGGATMQAPRPMRLCLFEAAIDDNVPELQRLRLLGMATREDYRDGLACAITAGSLAAAIHLFDSFLRVPCIDANTLQRLPVQVNHDLQWARPRKDHVSEETDLWEIVLQSPDSKWTHQLALINADSLFLTLQQKGVLGLNPIVADNLLQIMQTNSTQSMLNETHAIQLAHWTLRTTITSAVHPWQGIYSRVCSILTSQHYAKVSEDEIVVACCVMDAWPCGAEERDTLCTMLQHGQQEEEEEEVKLNVCTILASCFQWTQTGAPIHILSDHFNLDAAEIVSFAISYWAPLTLIEACLERVEVLDAALSDKFLLELVEVSLVDAGSRALAHIVDMLLRRATQSGVQSAIRPYSRALRLFLQEHLCVHHIGWSVQAVSDCQPSDVLWFSQRNSKALKKLLPQLKETLAQPMREFFANQESIHADILAHTSLAEELVNVVMSYA
jgi:hypothetical protein